MRSRKYLAIGTLAALSLGGACDEARPARGEALVVVDTDVAAQSLVDRLRLDVYAIDGRWLDSREVARRTSGDYPEKRGVICRPKPNSNTSQAASNRATSRGGATIRRATTSSGDKEAPAFR